MTRQELIARGVCIQNGAVLLAYVRKEKYFFLPGGHVEPGESIFETVRRELDEELGVSATPHELLSVFEHSWQRGEKTIYEINFLISFSLPPDAPVVSKVAQLDFKWIQEEEFKTIPFLPEELKQGIEHVLQNGTLPTFQSSL